MKVSANHQLASSLRRRVKGFTLIEVMIVVAIVAILAAIALPAYSDYIRRGKIMDATQKLSGARVKMEQWFLDNRTYLGACTPPLGTISQTAAADDIFVLTCNPTATTYTITADGVTGKGVDLFSYSVTEANVKASSGPGGIYTNGACWAVRKDGSCN